jgi:chemosensory pili system protein ChpA (sensor histidine kinase/response regulator)
VLDALAVAMPAAPAPVPARVVHAALVSTQAGGFEATGDEIDDEIREVFLEEFEEEIGHLEELLPPWRSEPEDLDRLRPIRRVFHTLKGSGRLVGARILGEFSWKVENMLNRVLDGTRAPSPAVIALLDQAFYTLPQLHAALRGEAPPVADLEGLQALADRVAAGEEAFHSPRPAPLETPLEAPDPSALDQAFVAALVPADTAPAAAPVAIEAPDLPASVDPVLLEILSAEVVGHLATIDAWLAQAEPVVANDGLLRSLHTMNGAFAMTEVPAITAVTGPAETYVKRLLAAGMAPTGEGVAVLAEVADAIRRTLAALQLPAPRVPQYAALALQLAGLRDSLPE